MIVRVARSARSGLMRVLRNPGADTTGSHDADPPHAVIGGARPATAVTRGSRRLTRRETSRTATPTSPFTSSIIARMYDIPEIDRKWGQPWT